MEEAAKMAQARAAQGPSMDDQEKQSKVELNKASVGEKEANAALTIRKTQDMDTDDYYEALAASRGKLSSVQID